MTVKRQETLAILDSVLNGGNGYALGAISHSPDKTDEYHTVFHQEKVNGLHHC